MAAARGMAEPLKELTNAFVVDGGRVLLGMKKRGFGVGKWNGFGGKLSPGESPLDAAQREMEEEAFVRMSDPQQLGRIVYRYDGKPGFLLVHVFRATAMAPAEPRESEEMRPQWFPTDAIPFESMWGDDKHWYELLLAGKHFNARFDFAEDMATITSQRVEIVGGEADLSWLL